MQISTYKPAFSRKDCQSLFENPEGVIEQKSAFKKRKWHHLCTFNYFSSLKKKTLRKKLALTGAHRIFHRPVQSIVVSTSKRHAMQNKEHI